MGRGCKSFEVLGRQTLNALRRVLVEIWILKAVLLRAQKEERRAIEKVSIILEDIDIIMNRMLLEM